MALSRKCCREPLPSLWSSAGGAQPSSVQDLIRPSYSRTLISSVLALSGQPGCSNPAPNPFVCPPRCSQPLCLKPRILPSVLMYMLVFTLRLGYPWEEGQSCLFGAMCLDSPAVPGACTFSADVSGIPERQRLGVRAEVKSFQKSSTEVEALENKSGCYFDFLVVQLGAESISQTVLVTVLLP